jgi:hypothetical protein
MVLLPVRSRCRDGPTLFLPLVLAASSRTCHENNSEPFRGQMFRHVLPGYLNTWRLAIKWEYRSRAVAVLLCNSPYGSYCDTVL